MTKKFKLEVVFEVEGNIHDLTAEDFKQELFYRIHNFPFINNYHREEDDEVEANAFDYWNTAKVTDVSNE